MKNVRLVLPIGTLFLIFLSLTCALARFGGGSIKLTYWAVVFASVALMLAVANVLSYMVETAKERPLKVAAPNYKYLKLKKKLLRDLSEFHDDPEVVQSLKISFLLKAEQCGARMYAENDFEEIFRYASRSH